jgi:hypothetical protein
MAMILSANGVRRERRVLEKVGSAARLSRVLRRGNFRLAVFRLSAGLFPELFRFAGEDAGGRMTAALAHASNAT